MLRREVIAKAVMVVVVLANFHVTNALTPCNYSFTFVNTAQEIVTSRHPVIISSSKGVTEPSVSTKAQGSRTMKPSQNTTLADVTNAFTSTTSYSNTGGNEAEDTILDLDRNRSDDDAGKVTRSKDLDRNINGNEAEKDEIFKDLDRKRSDDKAEQDTIFWNSNRNSDGNEAEIYTIPNLNRNSDGNEAEKYTIPDLNRNSDGNEAGKDTIFRYLDRNRSNNEAGKDKIFPDSNRNSNNNTEKDTMFSDSNRNSSNNTEKDTMFPDSNRNSSDNETGKDTRFNDLQDCVANLSVQHSTVGRVEGEFGDARIYDSEIRHLDGDYMHLEVKGGEINTTSVSGRTVEIRDSKIRIIRRLRVEKCLKLRRSDLGTLGLYSVYLLPDKEGLARIHEMNTVDIQRLESSSLVVMGTKVNLRNMTIKYMAKDAIIIRNQGIVRLSNVTLRCDDYDCINVETGGKIILRNVTLGDNTITKMDLLTTSAANMYPLFALQSMDHKPVMQSLPMYWVFIMTGCGLLAGMVIGSAVVWKKRRFNNATISTFTLSDLLSHDKLQEEHETFKSIARPDSGLSSSSFGSYTPFQDSKLRVERDSSTCSYGMNTLSTFDTGVSNV